MSTFKTGACSKRILPFPWLWRAVVYFLIEMKFSTVFIFSFPAEKFSLNNLEFPTFSFSHSFRWFRDFLIFFDFSNFPNKFSTCRLKTMEQVFRVDEQDFISRPICFRSLRFLSSPYKLHTISGIFWTNRVECPPVWAPFWVTLRSCFRKSPLPSLLVSLPLQPSMFPPAKPFDQKAIDLL